METRPSIPYNFPMRRTVIPLGFFEGQTPALARELLGQALCRRWPDGRVLRLRVTETEAYHGFDDKASHAHRGKTPRNAVMFGRPGRAYVYLCYGVHWLLNVTTGRPGHPGAILLRGVEGVTGPGRLTKRLDIGRAQNALPLQKVHGLWLEHRPRVPNTEVEATPRVGIDYAGPEWARVPWRFVWNHKPPENAKRD